MTRVKSNIVEPVRLYVVDKTGKPRIGETTITIRIERESDGWFLDFADMTFKGSGWAILNQSVVEVDATNLAGVYGWVGGFDFSAITNKIANDDYTIYPDGGSGPAVLSNPGVIQEGDWVDEIGFKDGAVHIDTVSGAAGTIGLGTDTNPSSNIADARTIADNTGRRKFRFLRLAITQDQAYDGYDFEGTGLGQSFFMLAGFRAYGRYDRLQLSGPGDNILSIIDCNDSQINGVSDCVIQARRCFVGGTVTPSAGASNFLQCAARDPGVVLDFAGRLITLEVHRGTNDWAIRNMSNVGATTALFVMDGGSLTIEATCTTGTITVQGNCQLVNNTGGATVIDERDPLGIGFKNGAVWADATLGSSTGLGTDTDPVATLAQARVVADVNNLRRIMLRGSFILEETMNDYELRGIDSTFITKLAINGNTFEGKLHNLLVSGTCVNCKFEAWDCFLFNLIGSLVPLLFDCKVAFSVELTAGGGSWINVHGQDPGVTLDYTGTAGTARYEVVNASGNWVVDDMDNALASLVIVLRGGNLTINATCKTGKITIRGAGKVFDNSPDTLTVNDERDFLGLVEPSTGSPFDPTGTLP